MSVNDYISLSDVLDKLSLIIVGQSVLFSNVFLVNRPHAILEAACFDYYCHYLALRMLSSIIKINVSILSVVCPGNVQIVQDNMLR